MRAGLVRPAATGEGARDPPKRPCLRIIDSDDDSDSCDESLFDHLARMRAADASRAAPGTPRAEPDSDEEVIVLPRARSRVELAARRIPAAVGRIEEPQPGGDSDDDVPIRALRPQPGANNDADDDVPIRSFIRPQSEQNGLPALVVEFQLARSCGAA